MAPTHTNERGASSVRRRDASAGGRTLIGVSLLAFLHAINRSKDEDALRSEWELDGSSDGGAMDATDAMLKERINLLETKERDLGEIKSMLRTMEQQFGIAFFARYTMPCTNNTSQETDL